MERPAVKDIQYPEAYLKPYEPRLVYLGRVTWQATERHKFNLILMIDRQEGCNFGSKLVSFPDPITLSV